MDPKYARLARRTAPRIGIPIRRVLRQLQGIFTHSVMSVWRGTNHLHGYLRKIRMKRVLLVFTCVSALLLSIAVVYTWISNRDEYIDDRDFTRGVLAVNTSRSEYTTGEQVLFQMSSLDSHGDTLCDSDLSLEITVPGQRERVVLSVKGGQIMTTQTCDPDNNVTNEPDYIARYTPTRTGLYKIKLTNQDTGKKVAAHFTVADEKPRVSIERSGATRINPFKSDRYPMTITLTAQEDFTGKIVERIPKSFSLKWQGPSVVEEVGDYKTVSWDVSLKAGETKKLAYEYTAPQVSPEFFKLGSVTISDSDGTRRFEDRTLWQIASDAITVTAETTGVDTSGNFTVTRPATATNEVMVVVLAGEDDNNYAPPSGQGWVEAEEVLGNTENDLILGIYYKVVTDGATEPATYTFTGGATNDDTVWWVGSLSGVALNSPEDETMSDNGSYLTNQTSPIAASITTASNGAFVLAAWSTNVDTAITMPGGSWATETNNLVSGNASLNLASQTFSSAGSTGNVTVTGVGTQEVGAGQFAFRAADSYTGIAYTDEGSTADTSASICATVESYATPSCASTNGSGQFTITTLGAKSGDQVTFFFDGGSEFGNTITVSDDGDIVGGDNLKVFQNTVIVRYETGSNITILQTDAYDNGANSTDMLFDSTDNSPDTMVLESNIELHVQTGYTFAPGGNVTTAGTGDFHLDDSATFTGAGSEAHVVGADLMIDSSAVFTAPTSGTVSAQTTTIAGTLTAGGSTITLTGTSGTLITRSGTFTQGTSTISVTSASGTPTLLSAGTTFHILTINAGATVVNDGAAITINNAANAALNVTSGVLNLSASPTGPGSGNGTLTVSSGATLCLGGGATNTTATCDSVATSTSAITMPTFQTYTFTGSTIRYLSNAATTVSNTPTYNNLILNPVLTADRTYTMGGAVTINGDFDIIPSGTANTLLVNLGGTTTVATTKTTYIRRSGSNALANLDAVSGSNYGLSSGFISIGTGGTYTARGSSITLTGISGTLLSDSGTFTAGTSVVTVTSASGTPTLLAGSSSTTLWTLTLYTAATVVNIGKDLTISSDLNISQGVLNANSQITGPEESGTLTIASGQTLCLGGGATNTTAACNSVATSTSAVTMPLFSVYTLTGSTVRYLSNANTTVLNNPTYHNLIFNPVLTADRIYTMGGAVTINGDFDIIPSGTANTLLVNLGGTTTVASTKTTYIRRSGSNALANLDAVSGSNYGLSSGFINIGTGGTYTAQSSTITLTGTSGTLLTNSGTFTQGSSTVTATSASGTPTLLGGTSSTTFATLTLNSAATVINGGNAFTIGTNMNVSQGVFNANAAITGPGGSGTLTVSSGATLCLGGGATNTTATCDSVATSTSAITMPTFQTYTFTGSTIRYLSNANTTVSNTPTYNNLIFNPVLTTHRSYTMGGSITINGDFTSNPTASSPSTLLTNLAGGMTVASDKSITLTGTTSGISVIDTMPIATSYDISAGKITIESAGTLTADGSTSTITLTGTSGPLFTKTGNFSEGSSTVKYTPDATVTLSSGAITYYNLELSPSISTAGRTYTFGSGTQTVNGDFTIQPSGTQLLTVNMVGDITVANTKTTTISRSGSATSKLVTGASNPALSSGNITIATGGTLDGTSSSSTITLTANGTPITLTGTYTPGSTTVSYIPASTSGVNVASTTYNNVIFNKASNTFSLTTGGITVTNDLTITAGVLDAVNGSNYPITVGRNWTNTPGTSGFEAQQGTVTFNTTTTGTISGATTFYNFTSTAAGKTIKFNDSTTYRINGLLTLTGSAGPTYVTLDSVSGNPSWTINHQGTEALTYTSVKNSACDGSSTDIEAYTSNNNYDAGGNGDCWLFSPGDPTVNYSNWTLDEGYGTTAHDSSDGGNSGTLTGSSLPTWQSEEYCVSGKCLYFEGTSAKMTTAMDVQTKTVSFWARPVSTTTTFLQLTASAYISASGGTLSASGFTAPVYYVNGVRKDTIEAGKWQHIVVTTGTTLDGADVILGNNSTNFYQGLLDEVRLDASEYTAGQVKGEFTRRGGQDPVAVRYGDDMSWISNGLVGYWKLDESSGNATDSSGNGNTLTDGSTTTYTSAKFGNGADLESSSTDYLYIADNSTLSITGDLTISAWIKPESVTAATLFDIAGKFDGTPEAYQLSQYGDEIRLYIESASNYATTDTANLVTGTWYHITGVYNATTSSVRLYVNGVLQASTVTGTIPSSITDDTARFHIGAEDSTGGVGGHYDGIVDEVRVYKRALSDGEVLSLSKWGSSPIAHWKLDEGSGSTAYDTSTNSLSGTLTNSPVWSTGKYGQGVIINGTQQYISVANNSLLNPAGDFTLEGWVKPVGTTGDDSLITDNTPLIQKIDGTDGYELGITHDRKPYGMLTNVSKTWTRYDNTGSADCSFGESYDDGCVINISATNNWDDAQVYTPFVFKEGSTYKMYYGGNDGTNVRIGLATSTNGYTWTRNSGNYCSTTGDGCVLTKGDASTWNASASYFPSVIKDGSTYKMWYGGSDGVANVRVGYATSTDGINWTPYPDNICSGTTGDGCIFDIGTSGNWDAKFVSAPSVIKDGSTYKMWYMGRDASNVDRIGYATSSDGISWTRNSGNNCSTSGDGCIVGLGGANTWYANYVSGPRVIKDGALYHMVFNGIRTGDDHYRLGYATSTDGITWTKYDNTSSAACGYSESYDEGCILDAGAASSWDDRYLVYPSLLKDGASLHIWYSGIRVGGNYRIGYATFTPGISDTTALSAGSFHHLSFVKSGTTLGLYVNGVLKSSGSTSVTTLSNTSSLLMGNMLDGSLDDLRIYNYARTPEQIVSDMNAGHPVPGSPVGSATSHWKFDEGYGTTANDSSINANNLTLSSSSDWTNDGKYGKTWDGDGTTWVSRTNDSDFDFGAAESFTLSGWFKSDSATNPSNGTEYILSTSAGNADVGYQVYAKTTGVICFGIDDDGSWTDVESCTADDYYDGAWHHFVAVRNTTADTTNIYIDGVLKDSDTDPTTGTLDGDNVFYLGDYDGDNNGTAGTEEFAGDLDEIKVYRLAMTTDQVKVEYNQGKAQVMGSTSTASDGKSADNSASRAYCPPGNVEGNCAPGQNPAPVAEWKLDENSGTDARDTSGNSNNGTLVNGPTYVQGKVGSGLSLAGSDQHVTRADDSDFDFAALSPFTIETWFRHGPASATETFVSKLESSGTDGGYKLKMESDGDITCETDDDDADTTIDDTATTTAATYDDGVWHHVACVYDTSNSGLYIYIDGVRSASDTSITTNALANDDAFYYGIESATGTEDWIGQLDELKIYPYVRTQSQIAWDFNRGAPIAHWKLDECGGTAIHSSNDIYNTALNGTWSGSGGGTQTSLGDCETVGSAWYNGQSGKYNGSLNFDGTDDAVDLGTTYPNLGGWTSFSVTGWFNSTNTSAAGSIVSKFDDADQGYGTSVFNVWHESGQLRFKLSVNGSWDGAYIKYPVVSNNTWHYFAAVWDGTNYKIYVDGKFGEQASRTGVMTNPATNFYIGRKDHTVAYWFNGKIDDVRVYNYGLSEQQIKLNYNGGQAVNLR